MEQSSFCFFLSWLGGEDDAASTSTAELDSITEMIDKCLLEIDALHLELTRKMLDGDTLTIVCARDNAVEVDLGAVRNHGIHFVFFSLFELREFYFN
jgi:hypothetical protein